MKVNQVFEIKFAYKGENEKGELSKKKLNVLAQCTNYTEAEKLAHTLIAIQELEKFEECIYNISLTNYSVSNVLVNDILNESDDLVMGLQETFFSNEEDGIFIIKVKFFGDKEAKEKDVTDSYLVPGLNINNAILYLKKFLINKKNYQSCDFTVNGSNITNAENLYLVPSVYDSKKAESIKEE